VSEMQRMLEVKKVTHNEEELEEKIKAALKDPGKAECVEVLCYPDTDGCCVKKGAL